jgi:hypothetical protein
MAVGTDPSQGRAMLRKLQSAKGSTMKVRTDLRLLAILIGVVGCSKSPAEVTDVDPGKPASQYGSKCYLELVDEISNAKIAFEDCTASAASTHRVSHVYLDFRRLPAASQRMYVSLVLGMAPLAPGRHTSARAGSIETTLSDGRKFSTGDLEKERSLQLVIEKAGTADDPDVFYVTGTLESTLVDVQNASSKLRLRSWINRPMPP